MSKLKMFVMIIVSVLVTLAIAAAALFGFMAFNTYKSAIKARSEFSDQITKGAKDCADQKAILGIISNASGLAAQCFSVTQEESTSTKK